MAQKEAKTIFSPEKTAWLLDGGLESLDAGERQLLLVMAETQMQDGRKPNRQEKQVIDKLRAMAGDDYDARDIRRKVKAMVKGRSKPDTSPLKLPPMFNRLIERFRLSGTEEPKSEE
jgi:hypothetical protein